VRLVLLVTQLSALCMDCVSKRGMHDIQGVRFRVEFLNPEYILSRLSLIIYRMRFFVVFTIFLGQSLIPFAVLATIYLLKSKVFLS